METARTGSAAGAGAVGGVGLRSCLRPPRLRRAAAAEGAVTLPGLLLGLARDAPSVARLVARLARDSRVSRLDKLLFASSLAYVVAPNDAIPDWIPFLGQLDDVIVVGAALHRLVDRAGSDLLLELWDGEPATLEMLLQGLERFRLDRRTLLAPRRR